MTKHTVWMMAAALALGVMQQPVFAQETCYQDDQGRVVQRRRPGYTPVPCPVGGTATPVAPPPDAAAGPSAAPGGGAFNEFNRQPSRVSPIPRVADRNTSTDACLADNTCLDTYVLAALPDRWRIVESLPGYDSPWWDPYNQNVLKGDQPVTEDKWFFNVSVISDTFYELRNVPTPVGGSSTQGPGSNDIFGSSDQWALVENLATEFVYYKGNTVFQPPDYEFRFTPVFNANRVELDEVLGVNVQPREGTDRTDSFVGIQAAFMDKHLRNVSDRFDFDSIRIGIQPFSADFRGFLFQDSQLGIRLFGTRANNVFQYNLAWFRRLEKDTNSGLNDVSQSLRDDDVLVANLYWQDMPVRGFTSQATVLYNHNAEGSESHYDDNGFIQRPASLGLERPRDYDVTYLGYNGDGHFGRFNVSASAYFAAGQTSPDVFSAHDADIRAGFIATELGYDFDWWRARLSLLYASGDDDPFDDEANGFDAVFENPQFAGADTSYWIRQSVPLIGGGRVALSSRNGILNSLRSSKEEGQSNFTNPGLILAGLGADADILPTLRASANWNYLLFETTEVLEVARNQAPIDDEIGHDVSVSLIYRPFMSQNIVVRGAYARLLPGKGFKQLFPDEDAGYLMLNVVLTY